MTPMSHDTHPRYHHGRSPAAWAGVAIALIGGLIGCIGFVIGPGPDVTPNWWVVGIGAALLVVALIVTQVLRTLGLGNS